MHLYGLIGFPLEHSFSKDYFERKFLNERLNAGFKNFPISRIEELEMILDQHPMLKGLAVTIPHKKAVVDYLYSTDDVVAEINACNCIRISNNTLEGFNTDVIGFEKSFVKKLQPHHTAALILGTGGVAVAVAFVLRKLGMKYFFVSRQKLANCIAYSEINERIIHDFPVLINCTPLGSMPDVHQFPPVPYQFLSSNNYLFDMVYNPALTAFLIKGKERGAQTCNGYEMLEIQAEENWRIWNE